jgi:hypothetical protein
MAVATAIASKATATTTPTTPTTSARYWGESSRGSVSWVPGVPPGLVAFTVTVEMMQGEALFRSTGLTARDVAGRRPSD